MKIDGINKETGEIVKPYETPEHQSFFKVVKRHVQFIKDNIRDGDENKLAGESGDVLVEHLMSLTGYYEELGSWLADEKLHLADLKLQLDLKFANSYCDIKKINSETNETARMKAKIICGDDQASYDEHRNGYDKLVAHKKYVGRLHDTVRTALSYEKSISQMTR